jgi:hypothetical protein
MAWIISWSSLLFLWAGGPLLGFGACLLAYCWFCGGGASKGTNKQRRKAERTLLPR